MGVSAFDTHVRIRPPCVIIRTPYIPLDKYILLMNQSEKSQLHYL